MSEAVAPPASWRRRSRPSGMALWWPLLLLGLSLSILIGGRASGDLFQLANPNDVRVAGVQAAFDALPDDALVLVDVDADLGTYPEIRPAVRAALDDLLGRGASLGLVSVSAEGRAIAAAELARLRSSGASEDRLLDLGFITGVEAGLVRLVSDVLPPEADGVMANAIAERGGGISAFDMALLVGGSDVGPRTWVEQVGTRLPELLMVGVAPTFAEPELVPYLRTGQLAALLATVRDDAAYVEAVTGPAAPQPGEASPSAAAMLLGMLVALVVLGRALVGALPRLRGSAARPTDEDDEA